MTRKEHRITRNDYNAYATWSDEQHRNKGAIVVTETDRTPVTIAWRNDTNTTRDDAHNEGDK